MRKLRKQKIKAIGLVEAIIAIFIVGIVAISFMGVATHSLLEYYRLEQYDTLTNENVLISEKFRAFIDYYNDPEISPNLSIEQLSLYEGGCHTVGDSIPPQLERICSYSNVSECRSKFTDELTFSVICFDSGAYNPDNRLLKVKLLSGLSKCGDLKRSSCLVSDQESSAVFKLLYAEQSVSTICTPSCENKCGGSDGCGGICPNTCSKETPYCMNEQSCVQCVSSKHCEAQGLAYKFCSDNMCVECLQDSDCGKSCKCDLNSNRCSCSSIDPVDDGGSIILPEDPKRLTM